MALVLTMTDSEVSNGLMTVVATITLSGSYTTGGDTLDFTKLFSQYGAQGQSLTATLLPRFVTADSHLGGYGTGATPGGGGYYELVKGTGLNNWKLQLFDSGGSERASGAYPVGVTTDDIRLIALFRVYQ